MKWQLLAHSKNHFFAPPECLCRYLIILDIICPKVCVLVHWTNITHLSGFRIVCTNIRALLVRMCEYVCTRNPRTRAYMKTRSNNVACFKITAASDYQRKDQTRNSWIPSNISAVKGCGFRERFLCRHLRIPRWYLRESCPTADLNFVSPST